MIQPLQHELHVRGSREQAAKQSFVSGLRGFILNDLASAMRSQYFDRVAPAAERAGGGKPASGPEVHQAMRGNLLFRCYSSMRYNAQEMVWRSALRPLAEAAPEVEKRIAALKGRQAQIGGALSLDPGLPLPRNMAEVDVHLAPGSYQREEAGMDWLGGALYDHGLNVFSFGAMGANLDDIGQSFAQYIKHRFPDFRPRRILDVGCTIGHNSCAWKQCYPEAEVTAVDAAAACLRYGHARALSQGVAVHFRQMDATALDFPDASLDLLFSSMFLHELPAADIRACMREAYRVLRPGGLMLHMELPPNERMAPYDAFYLDWDAYYNNEPFYKEFRDQDFAQLCLDAGFAEDRLLQFITPQYTYMEERDYAAAVAGEALGFSDKTGRLAEGIQWFGFGAWKQGASGPGAAS